LRIQKTSKTSRATKWIVLERPVSRMKGPAGSVDVLRSFPGKPGERHEAEFTGADVRPLERYPLKGRLEEPGHCSLASADAARLVREHLEPFVLICFDY
jgi:hypothetical protein